MILQQGTCLNGTYVLQEEIGSGGGGVVYKAYHQRLQKYVVVKQVKERVKGILESRAEADILKNIRQTYLPQVYDFLEIDGEIFTVMDYIPGQSLDQVIKREGRISQQRVTKWLRQLAEALEYLHRQNPAVIHSDIKPANIMLKPDDDICLIDFNISLAFDSGLRMSAGISGGYSPPEQYQNLSIYQRVVTDMHARDQASMGGNSNGYVDQTETVAISDVGSYTAPTESIVANMVGRGIDERSDVYSLGATLYHLLTGIKPPADFDQILPLEDLDLEVSDGLRIIIGKMMEFDPAKRYQNGAELNAAVVSMHELDGEFIRYKKRQRIFKTLIALTFSAGAAMTGFGVHTVNIEKISMYNEYVAEAGNLMEAGEFDKAKQYIDQAMDVNATRPEAYEREVYRLYQLGEYEACIEYGLMVLNEPEIQTFEEGFERTAADVFYLIGNACFEQEDYVNASMFLEEGIKRNHENSLYFRDYAIALARTGYSDDAEEQLNEAIELGLGEDSIYFVQGEIAYSRQKYDEAVVFFKQVLQMSPNASLRKRAILLSSDAYRALGSDWLDEEIKMLEDAEQTEDIGYSLHAEEKLADAYAKMAKTQPAYYEKSLNKFTKLYDEGYTTRQMMENLAILYQEMNLLADAETILLEMAETYPEDYHAYKRLAFLEADKQQNKSNTDRNYHKTKEFADKARALYESSEAAEDTEMLMLENMMRDLRDGGWF